MFASERGLSLIVASPADRGHGAVGLTEVGGVDRVAGLLGVDGGGEEAGDGGVAG